MPEQSDVQITETRQLVESGGINQLVVDDLTMADLGAISWSGSTAHLASVEQQLQRPANAVEYLCVRGAGGWPVAKAGIDYEAMPGSGTLWQVAVHPELQGLGIGTHLIAAAEQRIRQRAVSEARIGVEDDNDDALRLYLRLGYSPCGRWNESWEAIDEAGQLYEHHAQGVELSKNLSPTSSATRGDQSR